MSVSIKNAVLNVASEKYNKKNILVFFLTIMLIFLILFHIFSNIEQEKEIFLLQVYQFIAYSFIFGVISLTVNNSLCKRADIFPNIATSFKKILTNSIKIFFASLIFSLFILVILTVSMYILKLIVFYDHIIRYKNIIYMCNLIYQYGVIIFSALCFFIMQLNFITSLKFKDWFCFRKAFGLVFKSKKSFIFLFLNIILLVILGLFVFFLICFICTILLYIIGLDNEIKYVALNNIMLLTLSITTFIIYVYYADLVAQFFQELIEKGHLQITENQEQIS